MPKTNIKDPETDLRSEKRIPINVTVNIRYDGQVYSGQTQNVSKYGMYIEAIGFSGKKEREISIMMAADGTLHRLEGEIVWINCKPSPKPEILLQCIGVKLTEAQAEYLNYIEYLKHDSQFVH